MSDTIRATGSFDRARNSLTAHQISNRNDLKEGFAVKLSRTARKLLILKGEMLERSIRHAWKAKRASSTRRFPTHPNAYAISDLTFQHDHLVCVRKPQCSSRF
jgi:hypothetical protein